MKKLGFLCIIALLFSTACSQQKMHSLVQASDECSLLKASAKKQISLKMRPQHVVVVSLDGLGQELLGASAAPHIKRLAQSGVSAQTARTIYPSITLPSHTSMLTGLSLKKHQVNWNDYMPSKGEIRHTSVFDWAKKAKLSVAAVYGKEKFFHLTGIKKDNVRVDYGAYNPASASELTESYREILSQHQPHFSFIHYRHVDSAGHEYKWQSEEQKLSVKVVDDEIGKLVQLLDQKFAKKYVLIITADHGGHGTSHGECLSSDILIPWIAYGPGIIPKQKVSSPVDTYDTAATVAKLLKLDMPTQVDGKSVFQF